jgi:hypothetical protein
MSGGPPGLSGRQLASSPLIAAVAGLPQHATDSETDRLQWVRRQGSIDDGQICLNPGACGATP